MFLSAPSLVVVKTMQKDLISEFSSFASFNTIRVPKFNFGSEKSSSSVISKISQNCNENNYKTRYNPEVSK